MSIIFNESGRCNTFYATIHMAGDYDVAIQCAREYTYTKGACFQVQKCDYVYTGGMESGITARVICYPRFPKTNDTIYAEALEFAVILANKMCQKSFTIESTYGTVYYTSGSDLHKK